MSVFDDAAAEGRRLYDLVASSEAEIATLLGRVAELERQLAEVQAALEECRNPEPRVRFGVNEGGAELELALGIPLDAVRVFDETILDPWLDAGKRVYASVRNLSDLGRLADRYAGRGDVVLIYRHEPEDEGGTSADYVEGQRSAAAVIDGRVRFAPCLMARTWVAGRQDRWIGPDVPYDLLCVDGYLREIPWGVRGFDLVFGAVIADARARGLPLAITEVGVPCQVDAATSTPAQQAYELDKLHRIVAEAPEIEAVCYFHERITKDKTRDYRFAHRPEVLAAWQAMVTDPALR